MHKECAICSTRHRDDRPYLPFHRRRSLDVTKSWTSQELVVWELDVAKLDVAELVVCLS